MDRAGSPVKRLAFGDQGLGFGVRQLSRVGEFCSDLFVTIELREVRFIADEHQHLLPSFLTLFGRDENAHAWRGGGELAKVTIEILGVGEFVWSSNRVSEDFL